MFTYVILTYTLCIIVIFMGIGFLRNMWNFFNWTCLEGRSTCCNRNFGDYKLAFKFSYDMYCAGQNIRLQRQLLIQHIDKKRNLALR